jgi:NAD dependent epimerase/dehydratase family enzyme
MKILITGGTNGMGKGVAKVLAEIDNQIHEVILLCRSKELGEATIRELENVTMKAMATVMKFFGTFISIEECGKIMAPLFTEKQEESLKKSGKFVTWKNKEFIAMKEEETVFNQEIQERLWKISLELSKDEKTTNIAEKLQHGVRIS